jgi:hypothetical protein
MRLQAAQVCLSLIHRKDALAVAHHGTSRPMIKAGALFRDDELPLRRDADTHHQERNPEGGPLPNDAIKP